MDKQKDLTGKQKIDLIFEKLGLKDLYSGSIEDFIRQKKKNNPTSLFDVMDKTMGKDPVKEETAKALEKTLAFGKELFSKTFTDQELDELLELKNVLAMLVEIDNPHPHPLAEKHKPLLTKLKQIIDAMNDKSYGVIMFENSQNGY